MKKSLVFGLVLGLMPMAQAQVLPFNDAGVTMGHHHLMVPDVEAQRKVWIDVLGGVPSGDLPLLFVEFPGVFLILSNGDGTEGTQGSALDHLAFDVRNLEGTREKLADAGVAILNPSATQFDAMMPDNVYVRFFSNPTLPTPIAHRGVAFASTDPDAQREWWENILGAKTVTDGDRSVTTLPGARLLFTRAEATPAPTRGRALDHTGIGVKDVTAFCEQVAAQGVACELMFGGAVGMITDPAGVTIEINAGLESR